MSGVKVFLIGLISLLGAAYAFGEFLPHKAQTVGNFTQRVILPEGRCTDPGEKSRRVEGMAEVPSFSCVK